MVRHMCFQEVLAGVFGYFTVGFFKSEGFEISLQVSYRRMMFNPELVLGRGGGIHFRLRWLALYASLSLLPGSRLPHRGAYYPQSLAPPPLLWSQSPSFPSLPQLWQDQTRWLARCGLPWQRAPPCLNSWKHRDTVRKVGVLAETERMSKCRLAQFL